MIKHYRKSFNDLSSFPFPVLNSFLDPPNSSANFPSIHSRSSVRKNSLFVEKFPFFTPSSTTSASFSGNDILIILRILVKLTCNNLCYNCSAVLSARQACQYTHTPSHETNNNCWEGDSNFLLRKLRGAPHARSLLVSLLL